MEWTILQSLNKADLIDHLGLDDTQCRDFLAATDQRKTRIKSAQAENQIKNLQQESELKSATNSPRTALPQETHCYIRRLLRPASPILSRQVMKYANLQGADMRNWLRSLLKNALDLQEHAVWRDLVIGHLDAIPLADCTRVLLALDKQ